MIDKREQQSKRMQNAKNADNGMNKKARRLTIRLLSLTG